MHSPAHLLTKGKRTLCLLTALRLSLGLHPHFSGTKQCIEKRDTDMGYFDGKVAIITGAARGLGFDYATFFLQDGACVVLGDINCAAVHEATARLQASGRALGICLDVTDVVSTQAMAGHVMKTFG